MRTEAEQQLWNECSRLIANAVIYYNTALFSRVYAQKQGAGDRAIKGVSPVAWQHVNLFGTIEFSQTPLSTDLDALAARYDDPDYWNRALRLTGSKRAKIYGSVLYAVLTPGISGSNE